VASKPPFEAVVERHSAMVLRVCRAALGGVDADDAWSETFLSALRAYPSLPDEANIEAWLVTIAHRKSIDAIRAARRRPTPAPIESIDQGDPRDQPAAEQLDPDLLTAVRALPDRQQRSIAYHYIAGLAYKDVAEIMGGTPEAVRRAAADGIATLRRRVDHPSKGPSNDR
jgi:RNA polymerase sigma factor (sigma-70 family)